MTEKVDETKIQNNEDPLIASIESHITVEFQDRELLDAFLQWLSNSGYRVKLHRDKFIMHKEIKNDGDGRGVSDSQDGRESGPAEGD